MRLAANTALGSVASAQSIDPEAYSAVARQIPRRKTLSPKSLAALEEAEEAATAAATASGEAASQAALATAAEGVDEAVAQAAYLPRELPGCRLKRQWVPLFQQKSSRCNYCVFR